MILPRRAETSLCSIFTIAHVNATHPRPELDVVSVLFCLRTYHLCVMPKLERYNQNAMRSMAAAALATQAAAANARARPRLAGQCEKWLARPNTQRAKPVLGRPTALALPAHAPAQLPARTPTHARKRGLVRFAQNVRTFSPQVRVHARAVRRVERTV